ncbi:43916_t:CDS:1, partial [Gigaspora margarita]
MSNAQSNGSLRELNTKLLAEIAELRKKFAKIMVENSKLKDKNAEIPDLRRKFTELEAEKAKLKDRIAELLRQAVEESKRRDAENIELKSRVVELEASLAIMEQ